MTKRSWMVKFFRGGTHEHVPHMDTGALTWDEAESIIRQRRDGDAYPVLAAFGEQPPRSKEG